MEYEIDGEVPVLLVGHLEGEPYKLRQAEAHDDAVSEVFEATRPRGAPLFYGMLMQEKLTQSLHSLPGVLDGSPAAVICAGSGMDAEFLARQGLPTFAFDVSLGACKRTLRRARETGLPLVPVVADAENLPLADASVALAYVHDGLHHLENYLGGLHEMTRVAKEAISMTEPTQALATRVAVALGISETIEDSGNTVHRMPIQSLVEFLRERDFKAVGAFRYVMYYTHQPGLIVHFLSRRRLAPVAIAGFRGANSLVGAVGNKMSVQAVRIDP
jgi:hypothetical protein